MKSLFDENLSKWLQSNIIGMDRAFSIGCYGEYSSDRPNLVFLHGLGSWNKTFIPLLNELSSLYGKFNFILFDFHCHGETNLGSEIAPSIKMFAKQTESILRFFESSENHLIAHSMGGAVAIYLYKHYSKIPVKSLISLEGNMLLSDCSYSKQVSEMGHANFLHRGFKGLIKHVENMAKIGDIASIDWLSSLRKIKAEHFFESADDLFRVTSGLYKIFKAWEIESLHVFGEESLKTPALQTYNQLKMDGYNVELVESAGHVMMVEKPRETANICLKFLEKYKYQK